MKGMKGMRNERNERNEGNEDKRRGKGTKIFKNLTRIWLVPTYH